MADGFNPIRRSPPSPAQAGRAASTKTGPGIGRSCGCARGLFWLQKSTRGTWSGSAPRRSSAAGSAGSSLPASCSVARKGARSRLTAAKPGARWRAVDDPAGGASRSRRGESTRRGKASWCRRSGASLTRRAAEAAPGGLPRRSGRKVGSARAGRDRGRQRLRRKLGERSKTPQPGGTARRSIRSKLRQDRAAPRNHARHDRGNPGARGGTVAARLKLEVRRQAKLHPGAPGIGQSRGCSSCRSVAEVGESASFSFPARKAEAR
jgi:hypothetical protein